MAAENITRRKYEGSLSGDGTAVGRIAWRSVVAGMIRSRFVLCGWKSVCMSFWRSMMVNAARKAASSIVMLVRLVSSVPAP
jgi:hypothetical protein